MTITALAEMVKGGQITLEYCKSSDMLADGLTKSFVSEKSWRHVAKQLGMMKLEEKQFVIQQKDHVCQDEQALVKTMKDKIDDAESSGVSDVEMPELVPVGP